MNTFLLYFLGAAALAGAVLGARAYVIHLQKERDRLKAENDKLRENLDTANKRIEALATLNTATANADKKADDERKTLDETPDTGLAGRANGLFGR
ncbi:MAG: hypothetical protein ACOYM2_22120 [Rectinemataceae bacterium]